MRIPALLIVVLLFAASSRAQLPTDTTGLPRTDIDGVLTPADSARLLKTTFDSVTVRPVREETAWQFHRGLSMQTQIMNHHPYYAYRYKRVSLSSNIHVFQGKEILFYSIVALTLLFALFRLAFGKYFHDLFRVFFQTTMKQRQIREQLIQTPLPSLAFNLFFAASAGLYLDFMLHYLDFTPVANFWSLYFYCAVGLAVIYFVKFIGLKICGWLFNMKSAADSYIFIVFIINKVIGIFLLPINILLAFTTDPLYSITLVISWAGIACLLLYRFILGFGAVRNEVKFNLFHFFLYLLALEAAPLLLIYRLLLLVY